MARKSRKHVVPEIKHYPLYIPETVGYVRLSVKEEVDNSIENQKRAILAWGDEKETPIAHFYVDDGYSGRHFDRPAFQEMLHHIEAGHIGCVVVKDLSRLGREHIMVGYYLERYFPSKKVRFVSVSDQFETIRTVLTWLKNASSQRRTSTEKSPSQRRRSTFTSTNKVNSSHLSNG